jgi:hypothetical protein
MQASISGISGGASSFLGLAFSAANSRRRGASEASMPSNLARHL